MTLEEFNALSTGEAEKYLKDCNAAERWASQLTAARPFASVAEWKSAAEKIWLSLGEQDYLQAFEAHPMIGDVDSLRKKYASTKAMASGEQSGAAGADEATLAELSKLNHEYLEKFGFIFIVFATGKSAAEMLALLKARIGNDRETEIQNAAGEQLKITLLRLNKLLA
jgi:2-oxo-4-hydroxy-4-carboxy-5-ureidoimidazoline decarboxylase